MEEHSNFIKTIMKEDLASGKHDTIVTRFPPEPNGFLHIGHAKAALTNYHFAREFGGRFHLRFDDTNPEKEDVIYVDAIKKDLAWLGIEPDQVFYASDMFEFMYEKAVELIEKGLAFVDEQSQEVIRKQRGTLTTPGVDSPYRHRPIEENLKLFQEMRDGRHEHGKCVLRAKIDMGSPNINLRDPVIYRIQHVEHHHAPGWCIYPMYTIAQPLEDAYEGVTHSLCSLEFEDQRPFYDWVINHCTLPAVPRQIEFARLNLKHTVMSKRYLKELVDNGVVEGWDDPRLPTLSGLRRRGYTKEAIANFVRESGLSKANSVSDPEMLEHFVRDDLRLKAPRTMAVLRPLKVVITNYPENEVEYLNAEINPEVPEMGIRKIPFSREIYIEQEDFMESPIPKYHRLYVGNEVRLKHAYFIKCHDVIKNEDGTIKEIHVTYDVETKSGSGFNGRKVKGTIHWVDGTHNKPADFHLYEPILIEDEATAHLSFLERINPNSEVVLHGFVEESMVNKPEKYQIFRHGYFSIDPKRTTDDKLSFNHIVSLKSSFKLS
ncbi:MAG: glutamine--tRNA ligase/YqeY domain fusion protein [Defluviitaleaceae bacterium]|nr:glutamine--tRNA ligase/YqeY domain fusion protein [Defluviitaleaceae bacterium]